VLFVVSCYTNDMRFPRPESLFDRLAARLPLLPDRLWPVLAGAGLLAGTAVLALHHPWIGGGLLLIGFASDGLGQAMARRTGQAVIAALPLGLLLPPFGFALCDPTRALAAMFLMFALCVFTAMSGPRVRLVHWLVALGFLLACLLPDRFSLFAYILGIACFVKAGQDVVARS
jgi:hypothetical protein